MVSVIMPAYNCEKYIGEAIRSVLAQSVPFELIIIEDNATIYDFSIAGNSLSKTLFPLEKKIKVNG